MPSGGSKQHGCLVSALLAPFLMVRVVFFDLPKMFVALPRFVARSVASQSTAASGGGMLPGGVGRLQPTGLAAERAAAITAIRAHDPAFVAADLAQRAVLVHEVVNQSLASNDAALARIVMADSLWGAHRMLVSVRADNGVQREAALTVVGAEVVEAFHSTLIEEVRVRLSCAGVRCDLHAETGLVLRGSRNRSSWQEDLTFTRSAGALTPPGGGVLARSCPNCGAPLDVNDDGACTTCDALVMSGRQDWVLTGMSCDPW